MEDQLNKIGFGKSKKKESLEEAPGSCKYRFLLLLFVLIFVYYLLCLKIPE